MEDWKGHLTYMINLVEGELARHDAWCMVGAVERFEVERANMYRKIASDYTFLLAAALVGDGDVSCDAWKDAQEYADIAYTRVFTNECGSRHPMNSIDGEVEY